MKNEMIITVDRKAARYQLGLDSDLLSASLQ